MRARAGKRECLLQEALDLERLPSDKFDTNYLVRQPAAVAMNLLRLTGQNTSNQPDASVRYKANRRRIKTVMQHVMFKTARMIHHAGRWVLALGDSDLAFAVFDRHCAQLNTAYRRRSIKNISLFEISRACKCRAGVDARKIYLGRRNPRRKCGRMRVL